MNLGIHLQFNGQCQDAFEFYRGILGGNLELTTYAGTPAGADIPEDWQDKILHASLKTSGLELAGADIPAEQCQQPGGYQLLIQVTDESHAQQLFTALADGGNITFPLQKTFWSPCYGMVTDRFGIPWEINFAATA